MNNYKGDGKRDLKLFLAMLMEVLQPPGSSRPEEVHDVRILTSDRIMLTKIYLGCIAACFFLMINWKTWHLHLGYTDLTIHFPRLLGLSLIEGAVFALRHLSVHKHYKWGMHVVAVAIAVAISVDVKPDLLHKSWLGPPIVLLWAASTLAFPFCMTLLFLRMDVYEIGKYWFAATILVILSCGFLLLSLAVGLIYRPVAFITLIVSLIIFLLFGITIIDAFLVTILRKWK